MTKIAGVIAGLATLSMVASAHAAAWRFEGVNPGPSAVDAPVNATQPCGTPGFDFCDVAGAGFEYAIKSGISLTAQGLANGIAAELIQDINGTNQGLGVQSEGRFLLDQINADADESVVFTFAEQVVLSNVELNNGTGEDCPAIGIEGGCGLLDIVIDRGLITEQTIAGILAIEVLTGGWLGSTFEFIAKSAGEGFSIASLEINVPLPAALPMFLAGLACFGAVRRRKSQ